MSEKIQVPEKKKLSPYKELKELIGQQREVDRVNSTVVDGRQVGSAMMKPNLAMKAQLGERSATPSRPLDALDERREAPTTLNEQHVDELADIPVAEEVDPDIATKDIFEPKFVAQTEKAPEQSIYHQPDTADLDADDFVDTVPDFATKIGESKAPAASLEKSEPMVAPEIVNDNEADLAFLREQIGDQDKKDTDDASRGIEGDNDVTDQTDALGGANSKNASIDVDTPPKRSFFQKLLGKK